MSDFNLRHIVRDVLTHSTIADPRKLADEVFSRIPADDYGTALRQCLPDIVREVNRASRNHATPTVMSERAGSRPAARSAKVASIRAMWQQKLHDRVSTGPTPSEWRLLGDCGFDDLMYAAAERRELAARNAAKATEYEDLAEAVRTAGVKRVRDLPTTVLRTRLESEAA